MFYACVRLSLTGILLFYKTMSLVNSEGYSKKPKPKIGGFRVEKKWGEKKREWGGKILSSSNIKTTNVKKRRKLE